MRHIILLFVILSSLNSSLVAQSYLPNNLKVEIRLFRDTFDFKESIFIRMDVTNITSENQKVVIDTTKTKVPFYTSISLSNTETKESLIEYPNKAILISELQDPVVLRRMTFVLPPKEFIRHFFTINDIGILNTKDNILYPGSYELQITYCGNTSNKVSFTVK